jgi:hypothetical protein
MTSGDRLKALAIVWAAITIIAVAIAIFGHNMAEWMTISFGFVLMVGALVSTHMIMRGAAHEDVGSRKAISSRRGGASGKAKRSDMALVDRLIESMSDTELDALRQRLGDDSAAIGDDGEIEYDRYRSKNKL